ncbi:MAG TPA: tetratricopeptide repeat protein, partial [Planctomycetota bacterium]|nr:tetratricopeptide repeat protein [Planctomycetota bacterium]
DRMEEAVALIPADFDTLYSAALTLSYAGRHAKGLEFVERALEIWQENYLLWSKRGDLLAQLGREPQALISYEQAIRLEPHQAQPYVGLGYLHYSKERFQEAREVYEQARKVLPDDPNLLEALGASLVGLNRLEEAEGIMDRVTVLRGDAESFSNRAAVRSQRGHEDRAMEDFARALALAPDDANVHYSLATHLLRTEKTEEAVRHFERALKEGRDHPDTHYWLSEALFKLARYEDAFSHAREAIRLGRDDALVHFGAADNLLRLKRPAEAEQAYTRGLERQADAPLAIARRGQARCEQGRIDEGLDDYLSALRLKPAEADWLREVTLIHFMKKRYGPALESADRSIGAGRDDMDIHSLRGETLRNLERPAEAEKAFDRALERKKDDPILHFYRSRVRYEQGRKEEAFADLETAIRLKPDFAQAIGQRGMLKVKEKRPREALPDLRRALDLLPALKPVLQPYLDQALREGKPGDF